MELAFFKNYILQGSMIKFNFLWDLICPKKKNLKIREQNGNHVLQQVSPTHILNTKTSAQKCVSVVLEFPYTK